MSKIFVDQVDPKTGTSLTLGTSGDTVNIPSGVTIANAGTATGFGVSLANGVDNRVVTASSASALNGEANLTYNGTILGVGGTGDLGNGIHVKIADSGASVNANRSAIVAEGTGDHGITIAGNNAGQGGLWFANQSQTDAGQINYNHPDDSMRIYTGASERMRILGGGEVIINNNDTIFGGNILQILGKNDAEVVAIQVATNGKKAIQFANASGVEAGSIVTSSSSTAFNTSSDYRLKENQVAISDGIERLKTLKPYRFNFKADNDADGNPTQTVDGFFAHEVTAVPEAIQGKKDGAEMQGIDQSKLVPLLTSALQEAITKIETLETKVTALENA